jgi:DNA-binding CsgD family transcriptional regulator
MSGRGQVLDAFGTFLDQVRNATNLPQLGSALVGLVNTMGYERCVIVDAVKLRAESRRAVLFISDSKESGSAQLYPSHQISRYAELNDAPIALEELRQKLGIGEQAWRESLPDEAKSGVSLLLPVHRNGGLVLKVACNGPNADASPLARSMLHAAAHVIYDSLIALNERTPIRLTNREAECLRWMSLGKSDAEIGQIVGITPRTVRSHLKNAKQKWGANSPLEALVRLAAEARRPGAP